MDKFFKKIIIIFLVFSFSFLDIINLTGDLFRDINIVDNIWLAQLDDNVIDKFIPFEHVIDKLKISEAQAVANGDGKIFYSISANTTPRTRDYISSTNSFNAAVTTVAGGTALQSVVKASPVQDEFIAGYVNSAGTLQVMCYNGVTWTNEWSVSVGGTGTTRRFDISYETNSGDVVVLYSTNTGTTNELAYRTKPGASTCGAANWSAATNLDPIRTSGIVHWVKMAWDRRSTSNLITAIWADANADLSAMQWSGSAWGNEPASAIETALEIVSVAQDVESFDVEYESVSGDVMIVHGSGGTNGTNGAYYSTCVGGTSTCTWTLRTAMPSILDDATHIDISANPDADQILFGAMGNAGSDLSRGVWSGSAWTNTANADAAASTPGAGTRYVATGWLISGANTRGVLVYYDANSTNIGWFTLSGTTWTTQTDWTPSPVFNAQRYYSIEMDPFNKDRFVFMVNDSALDIHAKRLILSGTTFTWSNTTGGGPIEANTASATYKTYDFAYNRYIPAPSVTLTIGVTAGSKTANLNSGDVSQYANTTTCNGPAACSAFTLSISSGSDTVTSIKITETGTVNASSDLSNLALFYDTDGNYSNGVTGQYGATVGSFASEAATVSGSLAISAGTTYYFYVRTDVKSGTPTYPVGGQTINFQIAANADVGTSGAPTKTGAPVSLAGTTTVKPQITGYTNTTETGLNYSAACTNCGARIGPGSAYRQSINISGYGFGTDPGLGSRDTASNKVEVVGASINMLDDDGSANTNVSAWSNTSITVRTDTNITGDTDTDWGTDFGGAAALKVTAGGQAVPTNLNFYVFPQVTSLTVCNKAGFPAADNAREYSASDTACPNGLKDGEVILNGTRFGTNSTGGYVRILGCDAATCSGPTGSVTTTSWGNTAITAQVPTVIADNAYTGSLAMQQGSGSSNKTHTYTTTGFRVLPRIALNNPDNGITGDTVQITGNHLCQTGTCPTTPNRSTASDNVKFGSTQAVDGDFTSGGPCTGSGWGHAEICVKVPTATPSGSQPTIVKSNNYDSDDQAFNVNSPTPLDPTSLNQFKNSGLTQQIATGDTASSTPIYLTMIMEVTGISGGTLYPQIEYKPVGTSFSCSGGGACGSAVEGNGVAGPGPIDCSQTANNCAISISPADNVYHWQARVRHNKAGSDYYSNWVSYGGNPESATDVKIDVTAPIITSGPTANPGSNAATIDWNTSGEQSTTQVQYNKTGTFVNNCATNNDCSALDANFSYAHSVTLNNLDSGTLYYYRVRSKDAAGNEVISSVNSFTTSSVSQPAKTTQFHIWGKTGSVTGSSQASTTFSVFMPENATSTKSAFVEINGISLNNGTNNIQLQVNSQAAKTYVINSNETQFKILYKIDPANVNIDPTNNVFYITPSLDTYIVSAKIYVTYSYTP